MSKYSREDLRRRARQMLYNPTSNKSTQLIFEIHHRTGLHPDVIFKRIQELAE